MPYPKKLKPQSARLTGETRYLTFYVEPLERRFMLSGNVLATLVGADLWIQGDEFDNDLSLEIIDNQTVLVGNADTTINGDQNRFVVSESESIEGSVFVRLRQGDDRFVVDGDLEINESARIVAGAGDDVIGISGVVVGDKLRVSTGAGNDSVAIRNLDADRFVVRTGTGEDLVGIEGADVEGLTFIATGAGADDVVIQDSSFDRNLIAVTGSGDDDLVIADSVVGRNLVSVSGSGDDIVLADDVAVSGQAFLFLNSGDDSVQVSDDSEFSRRLRVSGGSGDDSGDIASSLGTEPSVFSFESDTVDAAAIDTRLNDDATGAIPRSIAFQDAVLGDSTPATEPLLLSIDTSGNSLTESNGTVIATDANFALTGQTSANSIVEFGLDGLFENETVADSNGDFSFETTLVNDIGNEGRNELQVRVTDESGQQTIESTTVHFAVGTVVRYTTSLGDFDVELLDEAAPVTVANFLSYFDEFENSIIHRSPGTGFVIQGGGFTVDNGIVANVPTQPPINSEFDPDNSNLRGTLSTALLGGNPDSATSGWFINTADNSFLDASGHTVFGRVIGDGLDVIDAIDQLPQVDLSATVNPAFGEIPLRDFTPFNQLSGTLSAAANSELVSGVGSFFTTELTVGETILLAGGEFTVGEILSDTELVIVQNGNPNAGIVSDALVNVVGLTNALPNDDNFVFIDVSL